MQNLEKELWRYPRFFTSEINGTRAELKGEDVEHIRRSLRMRAGDYAVICDGAKTDYLAKLAEISDGRCSFELLEKTANGAEPSIRLRLFQAMPKGNKMEFIIQKAVECGACEIIPFISKRCVSRPEKSKTPRYQKIAYEAAKQCGRGIIPAVKETVEFNSLWDMFSEKNTGILFYECARLKINEAVPEISENVDIIIGSEGGFEAEEAEIFSAHGFTSVSLGKRILRCETAPIAAISVLMNITGN